MVVIKTYWNQDTKTVLILGYNAKPVVFAATDVLSMEIFDLPFATIIMSLFRMYLIRVVKLRP